MVKKLILLLICIHTSIICGYGQSKTSQPKTKENAPTIPKKTNARPSSVVKKKVDPFAFADVKKMAESCVKFETDAGIIELEMFPETAPETVRNFLNLVGIGAFDTTTFSRVVKGFIIQGGNLATREKLTPELAERSRKNIADEPNPIKHERGKISMARTNEPNSASTNFFILVDSASHLDGTFSVFGQVIKGMEVVDTINKSETENETPKKNVRIIRAGIEPCVKTEIPNK